MGEKYYIKKYGGKKIIHKNKKVWREKIINKNKKSMAGKMLKTKKVWRENIHSTKKHKSLAENNT
jgi:hypothetical protein